MEKVEKIQVSSHTGFQPLELCVVGKSYPPEFYSKISNSRVRSVMEKIAIETEEDYQSLIRILEKFGVGVIRPEIKTTKEFREYMVILPNGDKWYHPPPMNPRDGLLVVGNKFFYNRPQGEHYRDFYEDIFDMVDGPKFKHKDDPILKGLVGPSCTRVGKDLYFDSSRKQDPALYQKYFEGYRCHNTNTNGHSDGVFCPVTPGLIVSLHDIPTYSNTFPGWEVVYLPNQSWESVAPFLDLKAKNGGKWWIPGQEFNDDVTNFVETWMKDWVGYVEETVFDVNMLVLDEKNVICNNYNQKVFKALDRFGITPHICNLRHRYFWDGGLHCATLDLKRKGDCLNYFPERP